MNTVFHILVLYEILAGAVATVAAKTTLLNQVRRYYCLEPQLCIATTCCWLLLTMVATEAEEEAAAVLLYKHLQTPWQFTVAGGHNILSITERLFVAIMARGQNILSITERLFVAIMAGGHNILSITERLFVAISSSSLL